MESCWYDADSKLWHVSSESMTWESENRKLHSKHVWSMFTVFRFECIHSEWGTSYMYSPQYQSIWTSGTKDMCRPPTNTDIYSIYIYIIVHHVEMMFLYPSWLCYQFSLVSQLGSMWPVRSSGIPGSLLRWLGLRTSTGPWSTDGAGRGLDHRTPGASVASAQASHQQPLTGTGWPLEGLGEERGKVTSVLQKQCELKTL